MAFSVKRNVDGRTSGKSPGSNTIFRKRETNRETDGARGGQHRETIQAVVGRGNLETYAVNPNWIRGSRLVLGHAANSRPTIVGYSRKLGELRNGNSRGGVRR